MMLVIDCEELNASIRSQTEELKEHSRHIFSNGTVEEGIEYQPVATGNTEETILSDSSCADITVPAFTLMRAAAPCRESVEA